MIQSNDQRKGQARQPSWGFLGPIPPIISIILAGATASAGSYIATRERLIIAEQRLESLQHQVADLKADLASLRNLMDNRFYANPKASIPIAATSTPAKEVTVTLSPFHLEPKGKKVVGGG